ncbi:hypothetical protein [Candidatus Spongiihabitans sp.]|uniref:hypothetical protein n=1 Tax=Candidatus Spongiihabitans sp. TaxID=3101308 RepID=UPI003C7BC7B8
MRAELETASPARGNFGAMSSVSLASMAMVVFMFGASLTSAYAEDSVAIEGLGFNAMPDDSLLSPDFNQPHFNQSHFNQSQGFKVNRISASWETEAGKLTVGNDWASFQDLLSINKGFESVNVSAKNRTVVSQIKWLSPNGFSISLEDSPRTSLYSTDSGFSNSRSSNSNESNASPSLVLSWQGGPGGAAGVYRVTAAGKKFEVPASDENVDRDDILGWGLNLEGGWRMGDLFAALSVTFGKGIDSYTLQRLGNDLVVAPNYLDELGSSLSIQPSLYYRLNNNSNFHVSLGHYAAEGSFNNSGIDTLDTINMGYSWSPWPSTKFGVEIVDQDTDGRNGLVEESTQVKFDAQKRF